MVRTVTSEGYNRVKSILEGKYGKRSKVVNVHIQSIMNVPYIGNADPYKIHRFYKKLQTQYTENTDTIQLIYGENMDQRKPEFEIFHPVCTVTISIMFISI